MDPDDQLGFHEGEGISNPGEVHLKPLDEDVLIIVGGVHKIEFISGHGVTNAQINKMDELEALITVFYAKGRKVELRIDMKRNTAEIKSDTPPPSALAHAFQLVRTRIAQQLYRR